MYWYTYLGSCQHPSQQCEDLAHYHQSQPHHCVRGSDAVLPMDLDFACQDWDV